MTAPTARPAAPPTGKPVLLDAYCGAGGAVERTCHANP
jgi:tRNA/tmRNA/rRNA uracil-C5-methylase (TrmA/RlmC/RlmD family)